MQAELALLHIGRMLYTLFIEMLAHITMAEISISIEIKYFGDDNNIIATFNIIPCIN